MQFDYYSGSGNSFLISSCSHAQVASFTPRVIQTLAKSSQAKIDGILLLETKATGGNEEYDYIMHYFNCDGSRASMCGNGLQAVTCYAYDKDLPKRTKTSSCAIMTDCGIRNALLVPSPLPNQSFVEVEMGQYSLKDAVSSTAIQLSQGREREVYVINTGVPHIVIFSNDLDNEPVESEGRELRNHSSFQPGGTNVNYIQVDQTTPDTICIRTYERGVEAETQACGTGACAAVLTLLRRSPWHALEGVREYQIVFASKAIGIVRCYKSEANGDSAVQLTLGGYVYAVPELSVSFSLRIPHE